MISESDIAAVLLTRGDVDMKPILDSLPYEEVVVWDNSKRPFDARVWGRYLAIAETTKPVIYFQDDDCIVHNHEELREKYRRGWIVANMTLDHRPGEPPMLGWGALFHRDDPAKAFAKWYAAGNVLDWQMTRYPESIFTALTPYVRLDYGTHGTPQDKVYEDLPWAYAENRSWRQTDHYGNFAAVRDRAIELNRRLEAEAPSTAKLTGHEEYMDELETRLSAVD